MKYKINLLLNLSNLSMQLRSLSDISFENGWSEQAKPTSRLQGKPKILFWMRQLPQVSMTQPLRSWKFWITLLRRVNTNQMWMLPSGWLTQRRPSPEMSGAHTEREMLSWQSIEDKGSYWFLDSGHTCCKIRWIKTHNGTWSALIMTLWNSTGWTKRLSWARQRINTLSQRCTTKNLVLCIRVTPIDSPTYTFFVEPLVPLWIGQIVLPECVKTKLLVVHRC